MYLKKASILNWLKSIKELSLITLIEILDWAVFLLLHFYFFIFK